MTYFIVQKGFSYSNWTFDIISHVFVLIIMTWAVVVAIRIKDDEAVKEMKTQPVMDFMLDDDTEKDFYMIDD